MGGAQQQSREVVIEQIGGILPEHPDAAGVLQQEQAHTVGEQCGIFALGRRGIQPHRLAQQADEVRGRHRHDTGW